MTLEVIHNFITNLRICNKFRYDQNLKEKDIQKKLIFRYIGFIQSRIL